MDQDLECSLTHIQSCPSARVIKVLLTRLDRLRNVPNSDNESQSVMAKTSNTNESEIRRSLQSVFDKDDYSVTHLLDDFHHLKYEHNIDQDDALFDSAYEFFKDSMSGNGCDVDVCPFLERHRRDRGQPDDDSKGDEVDSLIMDTLSMIHCYLLHSYETQRFSKEERQRIMEKAGIES